MTVTSFGRRAHNSGWTEAERERLQELADKLAAGGGPLRITFGVTDQGEPWCAVTNEDQEVLLHLARIKGQFVIHDAAADTLRVGETLWSACDRLLGPDWRAPREDAPREDVVVSLNLRQVQSVLAIALLANVIYDAADAKAATMDTPAATPGATTAASTFVLALAAAQTAAAAPVEEETPAAVVDDGSPAGSAPAPGDGSQTGQAEHGADHLDPAPAEIEPRSSATSAELLSPDAVGGSEQGVRLRGGEGDDYLQGGAGADDISGGGGDDTAVGGGDNDRLIGGDDDDLLLGQAGDDVVYGNLGDDTVEGGEGDDWVRGGRGDDSLSGGAGDDFLSGDRGADTMSGGQGADVFNLFADGGLDRVLDFSEADGDRVHVEDGSPYVVRQDGGDTVITFGESGHDQVVLVGVELSTLPDGWISA